MCHLNGQNLENQSSQITFKNIYPISISWSEPELCLSNQIFSCLQRLGKMERWERVWATAWVNRASSKEICDANDLLVFSWEQKGFQYGKSNRIHYLTISSKLMQDCAALNVLKGKESLTALRWAGSEASILTGCKRVFFSHFTVCSECKVGQNYRQIPLPAVVPDDFYPLQNVWTWLPSALVLTNSSED